MLVRILQWAIVWMACCSPVMAQRNYPPSLEGAKTHVYKTVGETKLSLWVYSPNQPQEKQPAIIFFFGGGWTGGSPEQFEQQCRYLASRGMVAITADYRVASRHKTKAIDAVRDAKSAVRWVRAHAAQLKIDPDRIAAGGGSAGGHLAACTGTLNDLDEPGEDKAVSSRPNALVLFNPAVSFRSKSDDAAAQKQLAQLPSRLGTEPRNLSPIEHISAQTPPTLIMIGTKDFLIEGNRDFVQEMKAADRRCELDLYEGREHGFFYYGRQETKDFLATTASMDRFLASLGYLQGPPTVDSFFHAASDIKTPAGR
jgi:acetyl esterase/lipase